MPIWDVFMSQTFALSIATSAIKIAAIVIGTTIILRLAGALVDRLFLPGQEGKKYYFEDKRAKTLIALLKSILRYLIYFMAGIMILKEFRIDTSSILAGAGIVGLAVGVGAQSLVRDVITGFFIILEDQFAVGDYITTADLSGIVEEIGFRVIKLRDLNGVLHFVPNGGIGKVTNFTRGTMQAVVNIPVAYEADIAQTWQVVEEVSADMQKELVEIIEGPKIVGFVDINQHSMVLRVVAKVIPLEQVKVEAALRHRIIQKFRELKIPFAK